MTFDPTDGWLQPPPDMAPLLLAAPQPPEGLFPALPQLEPEELATMPAPEPMPAYIQDLFETAGAPRDLVAGQTLAWTNAAQTSSRYHRAEVQVDDEAQWAELRLTLATGRRLRLRVSRYADVLLLEDTAGVAAADSLSVAGARIALEFARAVGQLMITH